MRVNLVAARSMRLLQRCIHHRFALGIERDGYNRRSVACVDATRDADWPRGLACTTHVDAPGSADRDRHGDLLDSRSEPRCVDARGCTKRRTDSPTCMRRSDPRSRTRRELRPVLHRPEQRLDERVVTAHARSRVRGFDAQPVQHGEHRRPFIVAPLSPWRTGLPASVWMPSTKAVRRSRPTA